MEPVEIVGPPRRVAPPFPTRSPAIADDPIGRPADWYAVRLSREPPPAWRNEVTKTTLEPPSAVVVGDLLMFLAPPTTPIQAVDEAARSRVRRTNSALED
jgi:hypothetical protein